MKNIITITLKLLVITIACAALLGVVNYVTKEPIAIQIEKAAAEARFAAYPEAVEFKNADDPEGAMVIPDEYGIIKNVYYALDASGNKTGMVLGIVTKGYSSGLNITVGIGADGKVKGVIIGDNNETQGLGRNAAEPEFYGQFTGKPVEDKFNVVKSSPQGNDIQAISGATVTSKAITNAVNTAVEFYKSLGGVK